MTLLLLLGGAGSGDGPSGSGVAGPAGSTIHIEFSPMTGPLEEPVWVDVSTYVRHANGVTITRGRSYELEDFQPGTCSLQLDNRLLHFDRLNGSGPFAGGLEPLKQWRVLITYDGVTYDRFRGFSQGLPQRYDISKHDATVPISLADAFWLFSQSEITDGGWIVGEGIVGTSRVGGGVSGTKELSGARIGTVLDVDGWPSTWRAVADGQSFMSAGDEATGDPLSYMKTVEQSEDGFLFMSAAGEVVFLDRHARYLLERMTTSQATFSDDGGDAGYAEFGTDYDLTRVFNDFRLSREGGVEQAVEDRDSIRSYRRRKGPSGTLLLTNDTEVRNLARSKLDRYKDPADRLPSMAIKPMRDPSSAFPAWLARELLDRCTVEHDPMNSGDPRTWDVLLEGYTETFDTVDFNVSANFSPLYERLPFIVGDPVAGVVGDRQIVH